MDSRTPAQAHEKNVCDACCKKAGYVDSDGESPTGHLLENSAGTYKCEDCGADALYVIERVTQADLQKFVNREVFVCQSSLVCAILANGFVNDANDNLFDETDIVNYYVYKCPECGQGQTEPFDSAPVDEKDESFGAPVKYKCYECDKEFTEEPEIEPQEIMEWWLCSDWLLEKLQARGEPVLHTDYGDWWGRTCTGQSIILDGVIEDIYVAMKA